MDADRHATIDLAKEPPFRLGDIIVTPANRTIKVLDGAPLSIEPKPLQVLVLLSQNRNAVISRGELLERCWSGLTVSNDAIERVVRKLRRLEAELAPGSFQISTIAKVGYRLDIEVPAPVSAEEVDKEPRFSRRSVLAAIGFGAVAVAAVGLRPWHGVTRSRPLRVSVVQQGGFSVNDSAARATAALTREIGTLLARVEGVQLIDGQSSSAEAESDIAVTTFADIAGDQASLGATLRMVRSEEAALATKRDAPIADLLIAQRDLAALVLQQTVGLVTLENVSVTYPPPRRDAVVFRATAEATRLIEQSREALMQAQGAKGADLADQALAQVRQALAIDDGDPEALVALAKLEKYGSPREFAARQLTVDQRELNAEAVIRQALTRDPNNPTVLAALADYYRRYQWRWQESENLLRRALAKDSTLVEGHWTYGYLLGVTGRAIEGLAEVRRMLALDASWSWRRLALPRLLDACGQRDAAKALYAQELARNPSNLFVLREVYLTLFITGDARGLRDLAASVEQGCGQADCAGVRAFAVRTRAAADAISGQTAAFARILAQELSAYDAPGAGGPATQQGRASVDLLFLFAIEFGWIGQYDLAISMLDRALSAHSLYWPVTLPYGIAQFPEAMRRSARYANLWAANPRLEDLVARRARALRDHQMAGVLPDGTRIAAVQ
jgi:DNA-binding winged helix-turn-helix (wHTH) protein/tetratricopeptide (TPR) repeat protein